MKVIFKIKTYFGSNSNTLLTQGLIKREKLESMNNGMHISKQLTLLMQHKNVEPIKNASLGDRTLAPYPLDSS